MDTIDRAAEWRRLKEVYAQMSDDELTVVAGEGYQLTDVAKQALEAEISNRRLDLKLASAPPEAEESGNFQRVSAEQDRHEHIYENAGDPDGDDDGEEEFVFDPEALDLVPLRRVWSVVEAQTAKDILDGAVIPSFLGDDNLEKVNDYRGSYERGVDLKVRAVDRDWASRTLNNNWPKRLGSEEADSQLEERAEFAVKCPKCRSMEVVFQGRDGQQTGNAAFDAKYQWSCDTCGHQWEDDGVQQQV
jgi:DNA-directed RNA polymerase subunit M/transcription elongation factor TFIIS